MTAASLSVLGTEPVSEPEETVRNLDKRYEDAGPSKVESRQRTMMLSMFIIYSC